MRGNGKGFCAIINIGSLASPQGKRRAAGTAMNSLYRCKNACIVAKEGVITYAGPASAEEGRLALKKAQAEGAVLIDAENRACVPGFIDSHTHFIFAGYRADEFFWRAGGMPYMEIHRRGGGIRKSMEATRSATLHDLIEAGKKRLDTMLALGVTTVEGKSGYGMDLETELRQLTAMRELSSLSPVEILPTFLGPHSIPPEFESRPSDYIDFVIREVLPKVAADKLAVFADIFCEKGVFEIEDSRRYLRAAQNAGFKLKLHADEIVRIGGAGLAAELGAVSADHLLKASPEDLQAMAQKAVIATCLPLTAFSLREPYADARGMIDRGLAVALASDLNPGSCYSQSIPLIFAIAVLYMKLTFEETLTALTLNGAAALGLAASHGSLETGKTADIVILDAPEPEHLSYHIGMDLVHTVVKRGELVYQQSTKA